MGCDIFHRTILSKLKCKFFYNHCFWMTNLLLKSLDAHCFHLIFTFGGFGRISLITSVISFLIPYADLCSFCRSLFSLLSQQQINPVERKIRFHMLPSELNQMSARIMAELLRYGELGPLNSLL